MHTDVGETDGQTGSCLPVGQAPWAPCLGEGSFSALILPYWGDLCERKGELHVVRSRAKRWPHCRGPHHPCLPLYLVVVWDPWNWAAMAVSQELLLEAERHMRHSLSHYLQRKNGVGGEEDASVFPTLLTQPGHMGYSWPP